MTLLPGGSRSPETSWTTTSRVPLAGSITGLARITRARAFSPRGPSTSASAPSLTPNAEASGTRTEARTGLSAVTWKSESPSCTSRPMRALRPVTTPPNGDTIRVSLLAPKEVEIQAAFDILQATQRRVRKPELIACPTCGRLAIDLNKIMAEYFEEPFPARAAIGVASLPRGAQVEMDCIAELE